MSVFYHYTSLAAFHEMQEAVDAPEWRRIKPILDPRNLLVRTTVPGGFGSDSPAYRGATFGLLEEDPESWWTLEYDADCPVLETILWDIDTGHSEKFGRQVVLLEVEVGASDEVYVADWGVHLAEDYDGRHGSSSEALVRVKHAYVDSLVPLDEYDPSMNYVLPEVVCFSAIPLERLQVVRQEDMLELADRMRRRYGKEPLKALRFRPEPVIFVPEDPSI